MGIGIYTILARDVPDTTLPNTTLPDTGFNRIVIYQIPDISDTGIPDNSKFKHKS